MRLLQRSGTGRYRLTEAFSSNEAIPPYAILSHTWGADVNEVNFDDLTKDTGTDKPGYEKIRFCAEQSRQDGLDYFWIDTCCINKDNKAELSHALNSMFRWYRNAARCYVYLSDVSTAKHDVNGNLCEWESTFRSSRWFTRGWTLQELVAPRSVEFFSRQRKRLGDKYTLRQQIHEITTIPEEALQGKPLSQFSVNDRLSWIKDRKTKLEEDKAYSLLGIFDVFISPIYGEGAGRAFQRLLDEIGKLEKCTQDLHITDPRHDKARIEETKGGLLEDSYHWILDNPDFRRWQKESQGRLLWIKGEPGKGKTMLLCGIINELNKSMAETNLLSYFFCQAADPRINSATAVLRGLLFMLVNQQPSLISHLREKYDQIGKALFEDTNSWVALSEIFASIVQDVSLKMTHLVIDGLDECTTDLPKLLDFIVQTSSTSSRVKWIMSSRNWPDIEERLEQADNKVRLSLELNAESVSAAVRSYIKHNVSRLAQDKKYSDQTKQAVLNYLYHNANDTFLWAALVCQNLGKTSRLNVITKLKAFPPGLDSLYERMIQKINDSEDANLCRQALAIVAVVYRPITLQELTSLIEELDSIDKDLDSIREVVSLCGSLLTVRDGIIYFVHQSAKDFLLKKASDVIFPYGEEAVHYTVFSRSLLAMSNTLRRDIYRLRALGCPIEQIKIPKPDPLAASRYPSIYWIDHLCDWSSNPLSYDAGVLRSGGIVDKFMRKKYLYWLEVVSLCKSMSKGVVSMARLEALIKDGASISSTMEVVQDARRFIMYYKSAIENSPLQVYGALLFSPTCSVIRTLFENEEPQGIVIRPGMQDQWSNCLQTLEGHIYHVTSVAFSHDSTRLASADQVKSVAFSHDSTQLASGSDDGKVKVWDTRNGRCLQKLEGHSSWIISVAFSHDSTRLASACLDRTVKVWDVHSGQCLQTIEGHSSIATSVAFSPNSTLLASGSWDCTVKIWDPNNGMCLPTLEGHSTIVNSVAFSHDSTWLASGSVDCTVKVWNTRSVECLQTLEGHSGPVVSVVFSHDSTRLASRSEDRTVKVWNARSGECLSTLKGQSGAAFSPNSPQLASGSYDGAVKLWDARSGKCLQTFEGHSDTVYSVAFSQDSTQLASGSKDGKVKVWDTLNGRCLQTIKAHSKGVLSVTFSRDSTRLASASADGTAIVRNYRGDGYHFEGMVKVWDHRSGECLLTLKVDHVPHNISFDSSNKYLRTDIGVIDVSALRVSIPALTSAEPHIPQYQGVALSVDGAWIRYNLKNLLWLPSEYRASCSAVSGDVLAMGDGNGKVWMCTVQSSVS
ncbi:beta transducin-like protein HET-D2Y [Polyplosphaeria fusca]|uniref:Beta transducin-like protein HET-D2Y n=1 Tax=Polyplosphaeria fusca TaxID=682080 RepID=A0A9P4QQJ1_9PLEO|nr:beta transducin-like protein HET-D2Y [Polyplosphaeria fusca]